MAILKRQIFSVEKSPVQKVTPSGARFRANQLLLFPVSYDRWPRNKPLGPPKKSDSVGPLYISLIPSAQAMRKRPGASPDEPPGCDLAVRGRTPVTSRRRW